MPLSPAGRVGAHRPPDVLERTRPRSIFPEAIETVATQLGVAHRVLDIAVTHEVLQRFRTFQVSPRICLAVRRHADCAEMGGSVSDRRRSNMDQQAVQERRRRGLNIAEVAFYSVLVVVITTSLGVEATAALGQLRPG